MRIRRKINLNNQWGDKMLKNEKGITLIVLIITVIIMMIIASVGITYGTASASEVQLQTFSYELQQIQGRVDVMHEKMNLENEPSYITLDGKILGQNITFSSRAVETLRKVTGKNYSNANDEELYPNGGIDSIYRYFSKKDLQQQLEIKNPKLDVIINFKTREVISVKPHKYNGESYYRLGDI